MPKYVRHTRRGRKGGRGFVAIPFNGSKALGALLDSAGIQNSLLDAVFGEDIYILSIDCSWMLRNATAGQKPIDIYINHGDLGSTEVGEWAAAELTDPDDIIQKEKARRPCRKVGKFAIADAAGDTVLNNGMPIRTKVKFSVGDGHALSVTFFNRTGGTLTTGSIVDWDGVLFGRWQR